MRSRVRLLETNTAKMNPRLQIAVGSVLSLVGTIKAAAAAAACFSATTAYSAGHATGLLVAAAIFLAGGMRLLSRGWARHQAAARTA